MPSALAVEFAGEQLTYAELNERANQLARYLRGLGVGPESLVGICIERSNEMLIGLPLSSKRAVRMPLDLAYPPQRLSFMLKDARPSVVLTKQGWLQRLPESEAQIVCVDAITELLERASAENLHTRTSENVAYVIYTSGSTGIPKGVAVPHRAVIRLVRETYYIRFAADEVFLQPRRFPSMLRPWRSGAVLNGARLVIMPPQTPSLAELGAALRDYNVTTLWLTAGLFHLMVDERLEDLGACGSCWPVAMCCRRRTCSDIWLLQITEC